MAVSVVAVEGHACWLARRHGLRGWELAVAVTVPGRWVRLGAFWGEAPGSIMAGRHWAWWVTRLSGRFRGVNLRIGWWPQPCLTLLAHTRPEDAHDRGRPGLVWALACAESPP